MFWIDVLPDDLANAGGVLCLRHAESMVVPRGWTLDDLRDPEPHLFRPPVPTPMVRVRSPRSERSEPPPVVEQLELATGVVAADEADTVEAPGPWRPDFDEADDLDGLLAARSPLLSRAFRTADRPDR